MPLGFNVFLNRFYIIKIQHVAFCLFTVKTFNRLPGYLQILIMDHLLYRRQFLLTTNSIESIPAGWLLHNLNLQSNTWQLYSHPDLEVTVSTMDNRTIILLGYLLDPYNSGFNNQKILDQIILKESFERIIEETNKLNGRFVLFFSDKSTFKVFNDASGFRELYYLEEKSAIHCGSTPDIIKNYIGAQKNPDETVFSFFNSKEYVENSYTWVGHDTIYKNIKRLPPNFLLDIENKELSRFWPKSGIEKKTVEEVAILGAKYITGCLHAASIRKPLHLGLTSGWDTRLLLAASHKFKNNIFYYLNDNLDLDKKYPDIAIPRKLSDALGFELHILKIDRTIEDDKFRKIFYKNNFRANDSLYPVFRYGFLHKYDNTYTVSGTLAEGSARKYYIHPFKINQNSGSQICRVVGFGENPYANRMISIWLAEAHQVCSRLQIDILDLYQIEHEAPNWCAHTASQQDIVREEIRPFNSRYLISLFWSLDSKQRFLYNPLIYRKMIAHLWADVLDLPINPSWKSRIYIILRLLNIDFFLIKIKYALKIMFRKT